MITKANASLIAGIALSTAGLAMTITAVRVLYATGNTFLWISIIGLLVLLIGVTLFMGGAVIKARLFFGGRHRMKTTFAGIFFVIGIAFVVGGAWVGNYSEQTQAGTMVYPYVGYTFTFILCGIASLTMGTAIFSAGDTKEKANKLDKAQAILT